MTSEITVARCAGCGNDFEYEYRGKPRKWCSEKCRKDSYGAPCPRCGRRMTGANGRGPNAPSLCRQCVEADGEANSARQRQHGAGRREIVLRMWPQGASLREIAAACNTTVPTISTQVQRLRSYGHDLPYREGYPRGARDADAA